jgi:hypothetical protein
VFSRTTTRQSPLGVRLTPLKRLVRGLDLRYCLGILTYLTVNGSAFTVTIIAYYSNIRKSSFEKGHLAPLVLLHLEQAGLKLQGKWAPPLAKGLT